MTAEIEGFIRSLKTVKDDYQWHIYEMQFGGEPLYLIRGYYPIEQGRGLDTVCPLMAVAQKLTGRNFSLSCRDEAGASLGFIKSVSRMIQYASDTFMGWNPDVRASILAALELEEQARCKSSPFTRR